MSGDLSAVAPFAGATARLVDAPRAVVVDLGSPRRALGWSPLGGGLRSLRAIVNHQVAADARSACERPVPYLESVVAALGLERGATAAMMTAASVARSFVRVERAAGVAAAAIVTAGCSNALRAGDAATSRASPGTINAIVLVEAALEDAALVEALAIAVEARALAALEAGARSVVSGRPATGTGTDCVVVAALGEGGRERYCGKHTPLGQAIGGAALAAASAAVAAALAAERRPPGAGARR